MFFRINRYIKLTKPKVVLSFTIKMNIYLGLIRLVFSNFFFIPNVTGLGSVFDKKISLNFCIFYCIISFKKLIMFFQNTRDYRYFKD